MGGTIIQEAAIDREKERPVDAFKRAERVPPRMWACINKTECRSNRSIEKRPVHKAVTRR